jgi:hypothetical protein
MVATNGSSELGNDKRAGIILLAGHTANHMSLKENRSGRAQKLSKEPYINERQRVTS